MSATPITPQPYDHDHENEINLFAETNFRNRRRKFGIRTDDRRRHTYVIGKTGMGKTTLLENLIVNDINAGHGCCYIDPHGDTAQRLLDFIPAHRINDVVYFNPADLEFPVGFNILEQVKENQKHLISAGLMGVFKKIWPDVWSPRMEYILLNTILALLDYPGSTLMGINRLLSDKEYRKRVVAVIQDPIVKSFWVKEFASWQEKYATEAVAPVQNKVGQFLSAFLIRNIVAQPKSTISMRDIMDNRKIFIVNLSKGFIGEENARLLGAMIITRLQLAAMERVDIPEEKDRQDFYLYVDEFQNFATESFASILSEARKYRLALIVAHQYVEQLDDLVKAAIFGNVGTIITFRVGATDAELLAKEFAPQFTEEDLVNLRKYDVYLKLMIDGAASAPFSAATLPVIARRMDSEEKVVRVSRERYATPRKIVEERVNKWSGMTEDAIEASEDMSDLEQSIAKKLAELQQTSPSIPGVLPPAPKKEAKYEMACSIPGCPNISKLTFEPDKSRPWFCKEHLELRDKMPPPPRPSAPPRPSTPPPAPRRDMSPPPRKDPAPAPRHERPSAPRVDHRDKPQNRPMPPRKNEARPLPPLGSGRPVIIKGGDDDDLRLDAFVGAPKSEKKPETVALAPRPKPAPMPHHADPRDANADKKQFIAAQREAERVQQPPKLPPPPVARQDRAAPQPPVPRPKDSVGPKPPAAEASGGKPPAAEASTVAKASEDKSGGKPLEPGETITF